VYRNREDLIVIIALHTNKRQQIKVWQRRMDHINHLICHALLRNAITMLNYSYHENIFNEREVVRLASETSTTQQYPTK